MKPQGDGYGIVGFYLAGLLVFLGFAITTAVAAAAAAATDDGTSYTEDLSIQRLGEHHVGARFVFRSHWTPQARHRCQDHEDWREGGEAGGNSSDSIEMQEAGKLCHFEAVFPRAVGVLLDRFKASLMIRRVPVGVSTERRWYAGTSSAGKSTACCVNVGVPCLGIVQSSADSSARG